MIIQTVSNKSPDFYQYSPPDQFVSDKEKKGKDFARANMDYLSTVAYTQFYRHSMGFVKNYNLVKGILTPEDFYQKPEELRSFTDMTLGNVELPSHVKHYPIINPPLNTLIGEHSKRPDTVRVKAYDDDSRNEELEVKTQLTASLIMQAAQEAILIKNQMSGTELTEEEVIQAALAKVQDQLTNYTSLAEKWGNRTLEALKAEFNFKELSEETFRDLLISAREYWHIYEDSSRLGLGLEVLNPKNVWVLTLPDRKYTSDPSGKNQGCYASGTIRVMEISEIIERFNLPKKEIDHLRKGAQDPNNVHPRPSNYGTSAQGENTIKYDVYSPLLAEERMFLEAVLSEGSPEDPHFFHMTSNSITNFGSKFVVVEGYWVSKKKIGLLQYYDEQGEIQSTYVDETYETAPNEVSIDWTYINQWYKGVRIGSDVYHVEPFEMLEYCPIIGVLHEAKNTDEAKSFIDLMKPIQILYNVCLNQMFKLLEKDKGVQLLISLRRIPIPKDGDGQDAIEVWEEEAREKGVIFEDDSPENMKGPMSNQQGARAIDLSRAKELQARYELAVGLKNEAWELVGISRARVGGVAATQTATGTQAELTQSYAQTEPYFVQHEYVCLQVQQAMLDAAMYIETKKPYSTISYINNEGDDAFIKVNRNELSLRDLKVFPTSNPRDMQTFNEIRMLSQAMLQNGATPYEIAVLYSTNSVRQMKDVFKGLKEQQEQFAARQQEIEQGTLQTQQMQIQAQIEAQAQEAELNRQHEATEKELDRINKKEVAIIQTFGRQEDNTKDTDASGVPDMLEISRLGQEGQAMRIDQSIRERELQQRIKADNDKKEVELKKLENERQKLKVDLQKEKIKAKAKPKTPKKK